MKRPNRKHNNSETIVQVMSEQKYLERIGRHPYNSSIPKPKLKKFWNTLYVIRHNRKCDCMGNRLNVKPPF